MIESKLLMNLIKRILIDRGERDYSLFFIEMVLDSSNSPNGFTVDKLVANLRLLISLEIENSDFSFFFKKNKSVILILTAKNPFGLYNLWKTNLENKITIWFFLSKTIKPPVIINLEVDKKKIIKLVNRLEKNVKKNLIENCEIYRHSETNFTLEKELSDFVAVSFYKDNFYSDSLNRFPELEHNGIVENKKTVVINIINCFLNINGLAIYNNCILKYKENNIWEYYGEKKYLLTNIDEITLSLQSKLLFYAEYIDIKKLLICDFTMLSDISENASYYLHKVNIQVGVVCRDGCFTLTAEDNYFFDSVPCKKIGKQFLVFVDKKYEEITHEEKKLLTAQSGKLKLELDGYLK